MRIAVLALALCCGCTTAHLTKTTMQVAILGGGVVERCTGEGETRVCERIEGKGFSAGMAGLLEAAVSAVSAYFTAGAI